MSQPIGLNFRTRIPTFSDDASIEEALKLYHYGVDNYSSQAIPENSIEGHFTSLNNRVSATEFSISQLSENFIEEVSSSSSPNEIVPENLSTVPLTIKGVASQTAPLQRWQSSSSVNLATLFSNGGASFANYVSIGDITQTVSNVLNIRVGNSSHIGIVVRAASGQSANLQEWQNASGSVLARVNNTGTIFSNNVQVVTLTETQTLTNKTLTSPTINGGTISGASSITLSGPQGNSSTVRNITFSTSDPSGGMDGDLWVKYI
jgi:hypothetical protein